MLDPALAARLSELIDVAVTLVVSAETDREIEDLEQTILTAQQLLASYIPFEQRFSPEPAHTDEAWKLQTGGTSKNDLLAKTLQDSQA